MRFKDKVALSTAAGSGIGRATADIIGSEGGTVFGVDTDEGRLKFMLDSDRGVGGRAEVADPERPGQAGRVEQHPGRARDGLAEHRLPPNANSATTMTGVQPGCHVAPPGTPFAAPADRNPRALSDPTRSGAP